MAQPEVGCLPWRRRNADSKGHDAHSLKWDHDGDGSQDKGPDKVDATLSEAVGKGPLVSLALGAFVDFTKHRDGLVRLAVTYKYWCSCRRSSTRHPALRGRDVRLGGACRGDDSFPYTDEGHPPRQYRLVL